jgi:hypothetical protein
VVSDTLYPHNFAVYALQPSVQLTEAERHAVHALSQWLRNHSTAPGDQDDLGESDEDGELAEAFTSSSRNSGAVRRPHMQAPEQSAPVLCAQHSLSANARQLAWSKSASKQLKEYSMFIGSISAADQKLWLSAC